MVIWVVLDHTSGCNHDKKILFEIFDTFFTALIS